MKPFFLPLALLVLAGCADETVSEQSMETPVPSFSVSVTIPQGAPPFVPDEAYNTYSPQAMNAVLNPKLSWQEADRVARSALSGYGDGPLAYDMQQGVSAFMLRQRLLDAPKTPQRDEAIAYYTGLLLRWNHGDPQTMASALEALEGTWTDARIAAAAAEARTDAQAFADQTGGCGTAEQCAALPQDRRRADAGARAMGQRYAEGNAALDALL